MKLSLEFTVHLFQECYVTMHVIQGECSTSSVCRREFFLPKQDFILSSSPSPSLPPSLALLFLFEGDHLRTCKVECLYNLVLGDRIHSLLRTVQSVLSCLSVRFKGIWVSWQNIWIYTSLYYFHKWCWFPTYKALPILYPPADEHHNFELNCK